jgi:F0F1-type ATP synthase delta subunit
MERPDMAGLSDRYASDLLNYAIENNRLEELYTYSLILTQRTETSALSRVPDEFVYIAKTVSSTELKEVLNKFVDKSRDYFGLLNVSIYSAAPLEYTQLTEIEDKLMSAFDKHVSMVNIIDPSLLGGIKIIAGNVVIDTTIKKALEDIKKSIYRRVYLK